MYKLIYSLSIHPSHNTHQSSIHQPTHPPTYSSIYLSTHPTTHQFIYAPPTCSTHLPINPHYSSMSPYIHSSMHPFIDAHMHSCTHPCMHACIILLFTYTLFIYPSIHPLTYLSTYSLFFKRSFIIASFMVFISKNTKMTWHILCL